MTDCEFWTRARDTNGYGLVTVEGRLRKAHRVAYEARYGSIPTGWVLRPRWSGHDNACFKAEHWRAWPRKKPRAECPNGHAWVSVNLYTRPDGREDCRRCLATRNREYRRRQRALSGPSAVSLGLLKDRVQARR